MGSAGVDDKAGHNPFVATLRAWAFGIYFFGSCLFIHGAQLLGAPLFLVDKDWFCAWMAMTKQYFGLLVTTMTQWWSPTTIRVSGDKSMRGGLIKQDKDGMLRMEFGERVVLMANHQLYTDWLYMWWVCYTNSPPMHGHIYIILKESLKYAPLLGPAMMFYGFIFMARKWAKDKERMRYRLRKLSTRHSGPMSGSKGEGQLDPMWLLIFPEGTNVSANTRHTSKKFSEKSGIPDMRHQLLPRSTGLQFCLQELNGTVEYLYDCTIGYEGIPPGKYGQDVFTLRSVYFQGRPPKSVNMHWRRFKVSELPLDDHDKMYDWVMARWREKDELMEQFYQTGKFPGDPEAVQIEGAPTEKEFKTAYINTEVKPRHSVEFLQIFAPVSAAALVGRVLVQAFDLVFGK
jgi:lysocardiolipin and lysophospholipid acyltransferase